MMIGDEITICNIFAFWAVLEALVRLKSPRQTRSLNLSVKKKNQMRSCEKKNVNEAFFKAFFGLFVKQFVKKNF